VQNPSVFETVPRAVLRIVNQMPPA
jgi:CspA family cold shock protein